MNVKLASDFFSLCTILLLKKIGQKYFCATLENYSIIKSYSYMNKTLTKKIE